MKHAQIRNLALEEAAEFVDSPKPIRTYWKYPTKWRKAVTRATTAQRRQLAANIRKLKTEEE